MTKEQFEAALAAKDPRYAKLFNIDPKDVPRYPAKPSLEACVFLGDRLPGQPCGGPLLRCNLYGDITTRFIKCEQANRHCETCDKKQTSKLLPGLTPTWTHQFNDLKQDKHVTNCSMIPWRGRLLLAYRTGWVGADIHIAEVMHDRSTRHLTTLDLQHEKCVGGREDPRLFVHDDELYLSFIGVRVYQPGNRTVARQLFARLSDDLQPLNVWEPEYEKTTPWEKNWQPFSHAGELCIVYSMRPWTVLKLVDGKAEPVSESPGVPWGFGLPRGGAAPILHGNEWYAFFHGTDKKQYERGKPAIYTTGVCTFENQYPFRPLRITREPILWPVMEELPAGPHGGETWYAATAFPCGAYFDSGEWVVSYGHNDHWCRASSFKAEEIEGRLCKI